MINHSMYGDILGATTGGRARKVQSDDVMLNTWWEDIQSQYVYLYDIFHDKGEDHFKLTDLHPENDENKTKIAAKFIRHTGQTYAKDPVTFWLQFQPGQECNVDYYDEKFGRYSATFPVGLFCDIMDESGKYNKWLCVNTANVNQAQFPTFELLRTDYIFQWIHKGKRYECPGVLQSQNSYNSGIWHDFRITTVEDQQKAALPLNEITETLWYDKSLLIDSALYNEDSVPRRWKVSKVNRISPNGICILTCAQEIFDEHRDYIEKDENGKVVGLWANYFDSVVVPKEVSTEEQEAFTVVPKITVSG